MSFPTHRLVSRALSHRARFSTMKKEQGDRFERFVQQHARCLGQRLHLWPACPDALLIAGGFCTREVLEEIRARRRLAPGVNPLADKGVDGVEPGAPMTLHQMKGWPSGRVGEHDVGTFLTKIIRKSCETKGVLWTTNGITPGLQEAVDDMMPLSSKRAVCRLR
jgi:hypothetical protein